MADEGRSFIETAQILIARHLARRFSRSFHFVSLRAHCRRDEHPSGAAPLGTPHACAPSKMRAFLFHASATQLFESPNSRPRASEAPSLELALFRMTSAAGSTVS